MGMLVPWNSFFWEFRQSTYDCVLFDEIEFEIYKTYLHQIKWILERKKLLYGH